MRDMYKKLSSSIFPTEKYGNYCVTQKIVLIKKLFLFMSHNSFSSNVLDLAIKISSASSLSSFSFLSSSSLFLLSSPACFSSLSSSKGAIFQSKTTLPPSSFKKNVFRMHLKEQYRFFASPFSASSSSSSSFVVSDVASSSHLPTFASSSPAQSSPSSSSSSSSSFENSKISKNTEKTETNKTEGQQQKHSSANPQSTASFSGPKDTYINLGYVTDSSKMNSLVNMLTESLKVQCIALPINSPEIAGSYLELAMAEHSALYLEKALRHYEKALQIYEKLFENKKHFNIAKCLSYIGVVHRDLGNLDNAEDYLIQALSIKKEILPEHHVAVSDTMNNLGAVMHLKGKYQAAADYFEDAIRALLTATGGNSQNPYIALSYYNLGCSYGELEQWENARVALTRGYHISLGLFGEDHDNSKRIAKLINFVVDQQKEK